MWGLAVLQKINEEAVERCRKKKRLTPFVFRSINQLDGMPPFPFPMLGSGDDPEGWEYADKKWRVDHTGCDGSGLSFSAEGFRDELRRFLRSKTLKNWGFGILEFGEFQLYVGAFRKITMPVRGPEHETQREL